MSRILDVYLHNEHCGQLAQDNDGRLSYTYTPAYLDKSAATLSVAMPLQEQPYSDNVARPFFSGLIPDERARERLAAVLGVSHNNTFGLLKVIGGECAGALSLLPQGACLPDTQSVEANPLNESQLASLLTQLRQFPLLGGQHGVRLSLAGAQDKLAICLVDDQIALPKNGRPTTHILKPVIERLNGTVENELFCMRLAARMGLDTPAVSHGDAGKIRYLLVERYDRLKQANSTIDKLHQEDFCQAMSVPPELKYEDEGGPGVSEADALIRQHTLQPAADRLTLQRLLIFHFLIGNADAHAKNYALLYRKQTPDLAPVYDAVCTTAYPALSQNMAMRIRGRTIPDTIQLSHWLTLVADTKSAHRLLRKEISSMACRIEHEADTLLEELKAEDAYHAVLKAVRRVIATRVRLITRNL